MSGEQTPSVEDILNSRISQVIKTFKKVIIVISGKGGVGKSTIATQLCYYMSGACNKYVGLIDLDICGPSIPTMTNTVGKQIMSAQNENGSVNYMPIEVTPSFEVVSIGHLIEHPDDPVVLRGPKKHQTICELLAEVQWRGREYARDDRYLFIDTPPGTSDEHITLQQILAQCTQLITDPNQRPRVEALIVTTPQEVSLSDVRKQLDFCRKTSLKTCGVVINMDGFVCPGCDEVVRIFGKNEEKIKEMCNTYKVEIIGEVPLDKILVEASERGLAYTELAEDEESDVLYSFASIVNNIQ